MAATAIDPTRPAETVAGTIPAQNRLLSLDALRGFDMFWIIGADTLFYALNKLAAGNPLFGTFARQLEHVQWAGFRFYDLIFPLFVFIVGVSIVFSSRLVNQPKGRAAGEVFRRFLLLYILGLFAYGGISNGVDQLRLMGVLQRIAFCYLFAALAYIYLQPRALLILCVTLLVSYWAMMSFVPVPGIGAGNFEEGKNLANYIDSQYLPLRKWDGTHDPEGLLSTLPAISTALLGIFAGLLLRKSSVPEMQKVKLLFAYGIAGVIVGWLWSWQFPVIKKIWTSSFVLVAGGFSAMLLGLFYYVVDVRNISRWTTPFVWIGTNPITIYMILHMVEMEKLVARLVGGEIKASLDAARNGLGDLLIATLALGAAIWICRFLYQRRIFLRV